MLSVPFRIPSLYSDLAEADGIASLEGKSLSLEIQTKDAFIGVLKSDVKEINVPVSELREVKFESKWFSNKLIIRGRKMNSLAAIPGCEKGELILNIARADKDSAKSFAAELDLMIQEAKLHKMNSEDV